MKFVTFREGTGTKVGLVDVEAGRVWAMEDLGLTQVGDMVSLIREFGTFEGRLKPQGEGRPLSETELLAPMVRPPRNIFCVGKNYHDHAHEFSNSGFDSSAVYGAIPEFPIIFTKFPESVIGPGAPIRYPTGASDSVDYEAELAVIIGREGKGISKADSMDYVWGYCNLNDMTARDLQGRHKQWVLGKSVDTFCPMGPWIATAEELNLGDTPLRLWVNGAQRQNANTRDLIFDVPTLIETISAGMTIYPGDVIATGTPAGVGIGFDPPVFLQPGDVVKMEIGCLGVLENRIEK